MLKYLIVALVAVACSANTWAVLQGAIRIHADTTRTNTTDSDVTITSRTNLNAGVLNATNSVRVNGTNLLELINQNNEASNAAIDGKSDDGHEHSTSDITSGQLPPTRIIQSVGITNDGTGLTVSIAAGDNITLSTNGGVLTIAGEASGEGSGNDANAIHTDESGEITAVNEKTVLANDDRVLIEDSAADDVKKSAKVSSILALVTKALLGLDTDDDVTFASVTAATFNMTTLNLTEANVTTLNLTNPLDEAGVDSDVARDSELSATQTGSHASPSTANPLAPTWSVASHVVWYGATGEIDLPAATAYSGKVLGIYNTGAFTITIDPNGSEVIVREGTVQTGGVTMTLSSGAGNFVWLYCDGTRWITLGKNGTLAVGS